MLASTKQSAVLILSLTVLASLASPAGSRPLDDAIPSLETLKTVKYTPSADDKQIDAMGYSALNEFINACKAYSSGLTVLRTFHEPVLTRGDTGIAVYRRVSPSVVMVLTANFKNDKVTDSGLGTGVVIDPAGYVLTNWHVVAGYEAAVVLFKPMVGTEPDANSAYGVKIIAMDKLADLALLKIVKPPSALTAVKLGDLSTIQVAEDIHIIGHPHGNLWSYSTGVISQIRSNYDWKYEDGSKHNARVLQMQTAINPGNSGGPVVDNNSNMLGLVMMSEEGQNLNYAIAIDVIRTFVSSSLANRPRGAETRIEPVKGEIYVGHTQDGSSVTKTVYPDLVSYTVRNVKGVVTELLSETTNGEILTGSIPNAFGGFGEWTFRTQSGKTIFVKSAGTTPDLITAKEVN
jgi:S1-C subfamily serine protease